MTPAPPFLSRVGLSDRDAAGAGGCEERGDDAAVLEVVDSLAVGEDIQVLVVVSELAVWSGDAETEGEVERQFRLRVLGRQGACSSLAALGR
jgi:hypothetical protein